MWLLAALLFGASTLLDAGLIACAVLPLFFVREQAKSRVLARQRRAAPRPARLGVGAT